MKIPQYAIAIFPIFDNKSQIDQLRNLFDPLASVIDPHITLVFPFVSDSSAELLRTHIQHALQGIRPFNIRLQGIMGSEGEYLFLNVKLGNDQIIQLHDCLYSGLLESHRVRSHPYIPHLTVGRLRDQAAYLTALETAQKMNDIFISMIDEICLIGVGDNYSIEDTFSLKV